VTRTNLSSSAWLIERSRIRADAPTISIPTPTDGNPAARDEWRTELPNKALHLPGPPNNSA
jgi:hypothetical protein